MPQPESQQTPEAQESLIPSLRRATFDELPVALLLPPLNPSRETFDEVALADLLESIPKLGIFQPLIVEPEGEQYRIWAGHRRFIAAGVLGLVKVPCMIYPNGTDMATAVQHHENRTRESVNPAQEARYFGRLLDGQCGGDVDVLCELTREVRPYVETRLILLRGHEEVLDALGNDVIGIGVAGELNKITDHPSMLMYLDAAIKGGASVRMVREWVNGWKHTQQFSTEIAAGPAGAGGPILPTPTTEMICCCCGKSTHPYHMRILWVHETCKELFLDDTLARLRGDGPTEASS